MVCVICGGKCTYNDLDNLWHHQDCDSTWLCDTYGYPQYVCTAEKFKIAQVLKALDKS